MSKALRTLIARRSDVETGSNSWELLLFDDARIDIGDARFDGFWKFVVTPLNPDGQRGRRIT